MTYQAQDITTEDSQPVYRFLFVQGDKVWRYTTAPVFIGDSAGTWEPAPIRASNVTSTNELAQNGISVELPRNLDLAAQFLGGVPEQITTLTVFRDQGENAESSDDVMVYWKGRVVAAEASGDSVSLECEDTFTSLRRSGLRARYQKGCRHALYSRGCGVVKEDYGRSVSILSASGFNIVVNTIQTSISDSNDSNPPSDTYWGGGFVQLDSGATRYIIDQNGTTLTLLSPFDPEEVDSTPTGATLYPGCSHTVQACLTLYNNLDNYGGFPYIPSKNPFSGNVTGSIQ